MNESVPSSLPTDLARELQRLAEATTLLVAVDFDGTLAPEVDDPAAARALPAARVALLRLLDLPRTRVALISGRALDSLVSVADMPDAVLLAGSHGAETRYPGEQTPLGLDPEEENRVRRLGEILQAVAGRFRGAWVEVKPAGFALHTRLSRPEDAAVAEREALVALRAEGGDITIRGGKNVLEVSVRSATKGEAFALLRAITEADAALYAGDDETDEDVFVVMRHPDLSLKSGHGDTAARQRVAGPADVADALVLLADLRAEATLG
ncbi:hypothetical protein GCM10022198_21280 [Klugiella xanthotipulae]|uniref:Trehalose 6-phosphate phosphatase n=1 Tax=Klugiella xanthotipulae TaxID=244735 RepID=A0A543HY93_9MICO|nr:trehalose-phosphatase [Klugiella xanthotipulae]TQM63215.1 trehalose 6-phosphatase [Klugiella xanthotipulae]